VSKHLVVIGGGAAGLFCAVNAARLNPALKVTILEKSNKLLSKVKVSGGGRCNVTHACFDIAEMSKRYPRGQNFVKKTFHQFFTPDTINWFKERGVKLKAEADGRMFPVTDSSQSVIDCLLKEASKYNVNIVMSSEVKKINTQSSIFYIQCSNEKVLNADYVCIASGGYPKSSMFDWLKELGHSIEEPIPSLFTFNLPHHPITKLMGVSVDKAKVKIIPIAIGTKLEEEGPLLITHWGLSGPVVLRLSAWGARELEVRSYEFGVLVNWLTEFNEQSLKEKFLQIRNTTASQKIIGKNSFGLPNRLWEFLALQSGVKEEMRWADLPAAVQNKFIKNLCAYECEVKGKTTFKEEFVTAGGIKLSEVDANTMMSKKASNLFFAGEVIDVDGITGGFNFQHAWTSGFIAGKAIATESLKH
jgi:predicted Rossmann fold flavoprotein